MKEDEFFSDKHLAERWQQGDRRAGDELYQRYCNKLLYYFYKSSGDFHEAEELTAETWRRVVLGISSFQGRSTFGTWLFCIARRVFSDHLRAKGRQEKWLEATPSQEPQEVLQSQNTPDSEAETKELKQVIRKCLEHLPPRDQAIICLWLSGKYTLEELSCLFGCSKEGVRQIKNRTITNIQNCLKRHGFLTQTEP